MRFARFYTEFAYDPYEKAQFRAVAGEAWTEYTVPHTWSEASVAVLLDIFYPDALPSLTRVVEEEGVPAWLWRREADNAGLDSISAEWRYRTERDVREVLNRIAGALAYHGWKSRLFDSEQDAKIFYDELRYVLLHRIAAPELEQWRQLGLDWAYGLSTAPAYRPQHKVTAFTAGEAQPLRQAKMLGDKLALENSTRKTAVTLPVENDGSASFIGWKRNSDINMAAGQLGRLALEKTLYHVMDACDRDSFSGFDPARNPALGEAMEDAKRAGLSDAAISMAVRYAEQGYEEINLPAEDEEASAESFVKTVISLPDDFIEAALTDHSFPQEGGGTCAAQKLWDALAEAVWSSGEPAVFFRSTIDSAGITGTGFASDAAGGLVFLPGSAAPAATINLLACAASDNSLDRKALAHVTRLMTAALEAATEVAPQDVFLREYRPLLLGVTNIAALLMGRGIPYDSDTGRTTAALAVAFVSGTAAQASAEIAAGAGAFSAYPALAKNFLQNIKDKIIALGGTAFLQRGLTRRPVQLRPSLCPEAGLAEDVQQVWEKAYLSGKETGFRHAHLTGVGTEAEVQALLGVQTPGIAPEVSLVRFEGYVSPEMQPLYGRKLNPMVPRALSHLGYDAAESNDIYFYAVGHGTLLDAPHIHHKSLREKGFHQAALDAVESALASAMHIRYVFNKWTLGAEFCSKILGFSAEDLESPVFDMLTALGFSEEQVEDANVYCCGTFIMEGAPHLQPAHLAIFDCLAAGKGGVRFVPPLAQIKMQAAIEPFVSGGIGHTVVLEHHTSIEDVQKLVLTAWELGAKTLSLYREGCSLQHPLVRPLTRPISEDISIENQTVNKNLAKNIA